MNHRVLVDADSIYFRIACKTKSKSEIKKSIDHMMEEIAGECLMGDIFVAVKGRGNFRKDLYPKYKANRPLLDEDMKKALTYGHGYLVDEYGAVMANDMEADDLVSIWAAECRISDTNYIIAGIDKDLKQIPGNHYNYVSHKHEYVNPATASLNFHTQCLTGDSGDNIPGLKGIGPVKAKRILSGVPACRQWSRVRAAWRAHKGGDPYLSRTLLKMLESFEELDDIRNKINAKTDKRKPNVLQSRQAQAEDSRLSSVSE